VCTKLLKIPEEPSEKDAALRKERGGYPVDSGSPYTLWFGCGLRGGRVNDPVMGNRIDGHRLLRQAKEDFASTL
jgi:hypothetical protein